MVGYVDYCCADQMSKLELIYLATEFRLDVEGCSVWWLDVADEEKGLKEIKTDLDALLMALSIRFCKEVCLYIKIANTICVLGGFHSGYNDEDAGMEQVSRVGLLKATEEDKEVVKDGDLKLLGGQGEGKTRDEENDFLDSDYSFNGGKDKEDVDNEARAIAEIEIQGELLGIGNESDVESDYARLEVLHSCTRQMRRNY